MGKKSRKKTKKFFQGKRTGNVVFDKVLPQDKAFFAGTVRGAKQIVKTGKFTPAIAPLSALDKLGGIEKISGIDPEGRNVKGLAKIAKDERSDERREANRVARAEAIESRKKSALQRLFRGRRQTTRSSFLLSSDNLGRRTLGGSS